MQMSEAGVALVALVPRSLAAQLCTDQLHSPHFPGESYPNYAYYVGNGRGVFDNLINYSIGARGRGHLPAFRDAYASRARYSPAVPLAKLQPPV